MPGSAGSKYGIVQDGAPTKHKPNLRRLTMKRYSMKFSSTLTMTFNDNVPAGEAQEQMHAALAHLKHTVNQEPATELHINEIDVITALINSNVVPMKSKLALSADVTSGDTNEPVC